MHWADCSSRMIRNCKILHRDSTGWNGQCRTAATMPPTQAGNLHAQYLLGKLCLGGDGVPQDRDAAYDWFQKAQAQGHDYAGFFIDRIERPESPNVLLSATRLLYHMGKIFQSSAPAPQSCGVQIDRKRLAKLRRMRMAAGHKADDHEQEQTNNTMSMGW